MRIAYIHDDKKINTGAHHINELMASKLRGHGVIVKNVYPKTDLIETSRISLRGVANILFFYSLLEQKKEILKYDLIQGTTYTPLTFLPFNIPVVSHFGSTTQGFLQSVPITRKLEKGLIKILQRLKHDKVISEYDLKSTKPLLDISDIEFFTASKSSRVIATSQIVKENLINFGDIPSSKIKVIHNAIEDYWYDSPTTEINIPKIFFLGRVGNDVFTWKLKGVDRLIKIFEDFPEIEKVSIMMTLNKKLGPWFNRNLPNHKYLFNFPKDRIQKVLHPFRGSIFLLTSRYEGFSLSLIESMSQGIIPIAFPVGVAPEIIKNGVNGFLVNSTEEATMRIKEILGDESLRTKMSHASYQTSLNFRADILADKLIVLYSKIISKSKRAILEKEKLVNKLIKNNLKRNYAFEKINSVKPTLQ